MLQLQLWYSYLKTKSSLSYFYTEIIQYAIQYLLTIKIDDDILEYNLSNKLILSN